MYLPSILPGEVLLAYVGRLTLFLKEKNSAYARASLATVYGLEHVNRPTSTVLVAKILGLKISDVLRLHTLSPLRNAFGADLIEPRNLELETQAVRVLGLAQTPRFCCSCIDENLHEYGCSYWHRIHFIKGAEFCVYHPSSALINADNAKFSRSLPHIELERARHANQAWVEPKVRRLEPSSLEFRYLKVCQSILEAAPRLTDIKGIKKIITGAAPYRLEVHQNDQVGASALADALTLSMQLTETRIWLSTVFPGSTVDVNAFVKEITRSRVCSAERYILACLHLGCWTTDTSIDAFHSWSRQIKS